MCQFEKNMLALLKQEQNHVEKVYKDKNASYLKSLEESIKRAQTNLEKCEEDLCIASLYREHRNLIPHSDMRGWTQMKWEIMQCKK